MNMEIEEIEYCKDCGPALEIQSIPQCNVNTCTAKQTPHETLTAGFSEIPKSEIPYLFQGD